MASPKPPFMCDKCGATLVARLATPGTRLAAQGTMFYHPETPTYRHGHTNGHTAARLLEHEGWVTYTAMLAAHSKEADLATVGTQ